MAAEAGRGGGGPGWTGPPEAAPFPSAVANLPLLPAEEDADKIVCFAGTTGTLYCLYEAPSAEAIHAVARRFNVPADVIIEVSQILTGDVRLTRWRSI